MVRIRVMKNDRVLMDLDVELILLNLFSNCPPIDGFPAMPFEIHTILSNGEKEINIVEASEDRTDG